MTTLLLALTCLQVADVPQLTADESNAIETITEGKVLSTVSFLASDEMAGRDTPSQELTIASAYVAARFRGAGLESLGADGSFYQETKLNMYMAPADATFAAEGSKFHGALLGGLESVEFKGEIPKVKNGEKFDGPAWMPAPRMRPGMPPSFASMLVARSASFFKRNGVTALVVVADKDHPIISAARTAGKTAGRATSPIPVVVVSGEPTGSCELSVPPKVTAAAPVRNVIGVLRGSDPELAKEAIIFSAHLDHMGRATGQDTVNNGADDDATGVTAVLSLADAFGSLKSRPKRSVIFMTFWGEEKGLLGSKYYASNPLWPLDKTVANINIEMVGRPEAEADNKSWMTGWDQSDLGKLMAKGSPRAGVTIFNHPRHSKRLYRASDNYSFVAAGVIAHSFSAGSLHQDYHQPGDEWEKLKIPHMTTVIRGLFAGSLPIAHGEMTPKKK